MVVVDILWEFPWVVSDSLVGVPDACTGHGVEALSGDWHRYSDELALVLQSSPIVHALIVYERANPVGVTYSSAGGLGPAPALPDCRLTRPTGSARVAVAEI